MADADVDASMDVDMLAHELVEDAHDAPKGPHSAVQGGIDPDSTTIIDAPPTSSHRSSIHASPSHDTLSVPFSALGEVLQERAVKRNGLAVIVPPARNRWEYMVFQEDDEVEEILEEYDDAGFLEYLVQFTDGIEDVVSVAPAYSFF